MPLLGPEALEKAPTEDGDEENDQRPTLGQFSRQCHLGLPIERAHAGLRGPTLVVRCHSTRGRRGPDDPQRKALTIRMGSRRASVHQG